MISDVLSDALDQIESHQNNPTFKNVYAGMEEEIESVKNSMKQLLVKLDTPPTTTGEDQLTPS